MQCDKINTEDMPQGSTIIKELPGREVDYGLAWTYWWSCLVCTYLRILCTCVCVVFCLQGLSQPRCSLNSCCSIKVPGVISYKNRAGTGRRMPISFCSVLNPYTHKPVYPSVAMQFCRLCGYNKQRKRAKKSIHKTDADTKPRLEWRIKDGNTPRWLASGGTPLCPSRYVSPSHHGRAILSRL